MTPTARTLAALRDAGWTAEVVERWIPGANVRHDLFGFVDVIALHGPTTLAVQVTSSGNVAARVSKIRAHPNLSKLIAAGWEVQVHGWRADKRSRRWVLRTIEVVA